MLTILIIVSFWKLVKIFRTRIKIESWFRNIWWKLAFLAGLFVLLSILGNPASAQITTLTYDVVRNEKVIGSIKTVETVTGSNYHYQLQSRVSVSILFLKYRVELSLAGFYEDGILTSASLSKRVNGKEKERNKIDLKNRVYTISKRGELIEKFDGSISYAVSALYFNEPLNQTKVYSETHLKFIPLEKISTRSYRMILPNGRVNIYTYKDNICEYALIDAGITKVEFILKNKSQEYVSG